MSADHSPIVYQSNLVDEQFNVDYSKRLEKTLRHLLEEIVKDKVIKSK